MNTTEKAVESLCVTYAPSPLFLYDDSREQLAKIATLLDLWSAADPGNLALRTASRELGYILSGRS